MIITQSKKSVVRSHDFEETSCTIDAEDMRYVASLLRNNYSNPTFATIRETIANAVDANLEAKADRDIEVTLPTRLNPVFVVRDFGEGLSRRDMRELYSKFGKSTKRCSNSYIGGFGIGKFAPLSYGDNFIVSSYHEGMKVSYNVFIDENQDTKLSKLHEIPYSHKDTGLEINVSVPDEDVDSFRAECLKFFRFFRNMPKIIGLGDDKIEPVEMVLEGGDWFFTEGSGHSHGYNAHAIMGDVVYPIDPHALHAQDHYSDSFKLLGCNSLYIRFPIGGLKLHHSRESIEYNKETQELIKDKAESIREEMKGIATNKLKKAEDLWDAKKLYNSIVNTMDYQLRDVFKDAFTWKGIKVDSAYFNKCRLPTSSYHDEDMVIKRMTKTHDESVTDNFKIKTLKDSYLHAEPNVAICIDDVESPHGQALRARTLFREDEDLCVVYILQFRDKKCYKHFCKEENFDKVSESRIRKLSTIEKAKIGRIKGGSTRAHNSRASVQVFTLNTGGRCHRNAEYWLDSDFDIYNESGIYVPIYNYRVVDGENNEAIPLGTLVRTIKSIEGLGIKVPQVYGVRVKDVKKLKKSTGKWKTAQDFLLGKMKGVLSDEKKLQTLADNKAICVSGEMDLYTLESSSDFWSYCKSHGLSEDSTAYKLLYAINVTKVHLSSKADKISKAYEYARILDNDYELSLPTSNIDIEKLRGTAFALYPMIGRLSFNSWGSSKNDKMDGLNYIKQIDELNRLKEIEKGEIRLEEVA